MIIAGSVDSKSKAEDARKKEAGQTVGSPPQMISEKKMLKTETPRPQIATGPRSPKHNPEIVSGTWVVDGDELVQTVAWMKEGDYQPFTKDLVTKVFFGEFQWTDYDFTVDLMGIGGQVHGSVYLYCRSTDRDQFRNTNLIELKIPLGESPASLSASAYDSATSRSLLPTTGIYPLDIPKWYSVHIKVRGSQIEYSLRDGPRVVAQISPVTIQGHLNGRVGLGTKSASCRFKNIRVLALDGKVLCDGVRDIDWPNERVRKLEAATDRIGQAASEPVERRTAQERTSFDGNAIRLAGYWYRDPQELFQNRSDGIGRILLGKTALTAYDLRFRCMINEPGSIGVIFHRNGPSQSSSFVIGDSGENVLRTRMKGRDSDQILARKPGRLRPGRWYEVMLRVNGDRVECYVDHDLVLDHHELPSKEGRVGLESRNTLARFRDIVISAPGGMRIWAGPPSISAKGKKEPDILSGSWRIDENTAELVQAEIVGEGKMLLRDPRDSLNWSPSFILSFDVKAEVGFPEVRVMHGGRVLRIGGSDADRGGLFDDQGRPVGVHGTVKLPRLALGRWHSVKVSVNGDDLRCDVDGIEWFHDRVPVIPGVIGLGTWKTAARFRKISVRSIGGAVLWEEGLPDLPRE